MSALLMLGVAKLAAQTNTAQTNIYIALNANFRLTAEVQVSAQSITNVAIRTKDLIRAIGAITTNNFSPHARLVLLFRVVGGVPFFVVRDGTNEVDTAEYLTARQIGTPLARLRNGRNGLVTGTVYVEEGFRLVNLEPWDFEVQGFNVAQQSNRGQNGNLLPKYGPTSLVIDVDGPGTVEGSPAVVRGLFTATGQTQELRVDAQ